MEADWPSAYLCLQWPRNLLYGALAPSSSKLLHQRQQLEQVTGKSDKRQGAGEQNYLGE
jgi:hypothetical protein